MYSDNEEDSGWTRFAGALKNALILLGGVFATTLLFICLFYFKLMKVSGVASPKRAKGRRQRALTWSHYSVAQERGGPALHSC